MTCAKFLNLALACFNQPISSVAADVGATFDNNDCLWDSMLANADQVGSQIPKTLLLFVALLSLRGDLTTR